MVVINGIKEGLGLKIRKKLVASSAYGVRGYGAFHYGAGAQFHGIYRVGTRWNRTEQHKMPFYVPTNPQTDRQQSHRLKIHNLAAAWQGLTDEQKNYYNNLKEPERISGQNRFIHFCFYDPSRPHCPMPQFLELGDTPASYAGQAGKYVLVNAEENALEFGTVVAANKALSNLENVAVNTHLIGDLHLYRNLGSKDIFWYKGFINQLYFSSSRYILGLTNKIAVAGILHPLSNLFYALGWPGYYWYKTYTGRLHLNATAFLDGAVAGHLLFTGDLVPATDDTEWVGQLEDPFKAIKGLVVKDTTNGKHYKVEVVNGALTATALD